MKITSANKNTHDATNTAILTVLAIVSCACSKSRDGHHCEFSVHCQISGNVRPLADKPTAQLTFDTLFGHRP